ncbi:hypothetical protein Vretimale_17150 [Volvox reticuliferus]|uniref:3'-5' exonuclease domain-containing protein n=1 Tax=Volvox reticuliferus TaxID=1737510 RepID=A0A8J4FXP8_9CHLO|nr:hypothetical protein Vretifemale_18595 [Volvox reticuliferus]GIM14135.1 hypothetical protein Vretimale_17150 [Volvox reticuliferus]
MLSRQLYIGHSSAHHTWLDRGQGVVLLTAQANYTLRHNSPVAHHGKDVASSFGGRSRADPMELRATAEPASHAASRPTPDQAAQSSARSESFETTKVPDNPQLASAAHWRPSSADLQRLDPEGADGGLLGDGGGTAAMESCSATPPNNINPQTLLFDRRNHQRRLQANAYSSHLPGKAASASWETSEHAYTPSTLQASDSSAHRDRAADSPFPQVAVDEVGSVGGGGDTGSGGAMMLPLSPVYPAIDSGLNSLVASALAFDEAAFQGGTWGDADWELEDLRPLDAEAANMLNSSSRNRAEPVSSSNSSSGNAASYSSRCGGRRRRAGGGISLDDEEGTWDVEVYDDKGTSDDDGGVAEAAATGAGGFLSGIRDADVFITRAGPPRRGPPVTQERRNDDDEAGTDGDFWPQRRGRDGRCRRVRVSGRRWEDDCEDDGDPNGNGRAAGALTRSWMRASDPGGSLDIDKWSTANPDDIGDVRTRGACMSGDMGGGMGDRNGGVGSLPGGRRAVIASESALRRNLAAVSTRLPRIGQSVTFPLPPAICTAATLGAAAAAGAAVEPATLPQPESPSARESAGFQQQSPPVTDMHPSAVGTAAAAPSTTPAVANPNAAAAGGPHDWATVPLSYDFGPSFKLLEENAVPQEVPLPEELLALAGRLPDSGGGGRSAVDALLPGCTAFTIACDYQILLVQNSRSVGPAVAWLRASVGADRVVGIDTEWPPTFKAGTSARLALLQLASPSRVLLLHIAQMRPKVTAPGGPIHSLLSDASLTWVGSGWSHSDRFVMTEALGMALPQTVVDVQVAARAAGWPRVGLLGLVNDLMGASEFQKPRKLSMCNWAAATMSGRQIRYAVLDALLPPILLRRLRLFASMPGLRCSFCKQAMHAPRQHEHISPAPRDLPHVCEHCGRTIRSSSIDNSSCDIPMDVVVGVQPADIDLQARGPTRCSPSAPRPASKAGSLRTYLQSVVEGRQQQRRTLGQRGLRHRRLFSSHDFGADGDSDPELDSDSGSGSDLGVEGESASGGGKEVTTETTAGKSKSKRKKKRMVRPVAGGGAMSAASSRQQALWHAFEEASPAAAAAVVLAMTGQDGSSEDAAAPAFGAQQAD